MQVLVATVILMRYFLSKEMFAGLVLIAGGICFLRFVRAEGISFVKGVWPILLIIILGLIHILNHDVRDVARDFAFGLSAISLFALGYGVAAQNSMAWIMMMRVMVLGGLGVALVHLFELFQNHQLLYAGVNELRDVVSFKTVALVIVSICLLFFIFRMTGVRLFSSLVEKAVFLPVLCLSAVLSFSRTGLVIAAILVFAMTGWLTRLRLKTSLIFGVIVLGAWFFVSTAPQSETDTFRGKLARSFSELSVVDYISDKDINENWRGFETHQVLQTYLDGNLFQKLAGQGFGTLVDLGFYINLGGEEMRHIPVFHNGYGYVLLKTGALGLACYFFFFGKILKFSRSFVFSQNGEQIFLSRLLSGAVLCSMFMMFVVGGMPQLNGVEFVVLMGCLVRQLTNSEALQYDSGVQA